MSQRNESLPDLSDLLAGRDVRDEPVRLADGVWWVGHYLEGDPFQCHVYLIAHGDQSVLFDPGSALTFRHTPRKVEQILPLSDIRYFVCHHQDPDIAGALPLIDALACRDDATIVTHWRAEKLLRHLGLRRLKFWLVDEHGWELDLGGRVLDFRLTPYAHFPGAFVSRDRTSGIVFSSDLFGGFTEGFKLMAEDASHFEALRPFHEHYIPGREVLRHAVDVVERLGPTMIAPQHGSIIPGHLIPLVCRRLRDLECGLYLMVGQTSDIGRLMRASETLRSLNSTLLHEREFKAVAARFHQLAADLLPVDTLEFWAEVEDDGAALHFAPEQRFRGRRTVFPEWLDDALAAAALREGGAPVVPVVIPGRHDAEGGQPALVHALRVGEHGRARGAFVLRLTEAVAVDDAVGELLDRMGTAVEVAVEREALLRMIEQERQHFYERSVRDALTGLYTRRYLEEMFPRLALVHDRDDDHPIALLMLDVDRFKSVNDRWGHQAGDAVLARLGEVLNDAVRGNDLAVRLGGEEFVVILDNAAEEQAMLVAERLRKRFAELAWEGDMAEASFTVSIGVAGRMPGEDLVALLERADRALYAAKRGGRDRVVRAAASTTPPESG